MARRLNTYVHVHHDGESKAYGPGDDIPKDVAKLITNPDVWDGEDTIETGSGDDGGSTGKTPSPTEEPPRSGKGSGEDLWKAYAVETLHLDVADGADRKDIIALVDAHKAKTTEGVGTGIPGPDADIAAWVDYAASHDLEFEADDDATIADIRSALADAGVATE